MKRLFLMSLAVALMTTASITTINAQPQRGGNPEMREQREKPTTEEMAAKITEKMSERIGLSEAQAKKVYKINLDYLKKVEEAKKLKSKRDKSVLDILDDDQTIEYLDMLSSSKKGGRPMPKGQPQRGGKGGEKSGDKGGRAKRPCPQTPPAAPATAATVAE